MKAGKYHGEQERAAEELSFFRRAAYLPGRPRLFRGGGVMSPDLDSVVTKINFVLCQGAAEDKRHLVTALSDQS